ncbi:MAG: hypothetical protein WB817_17150 [Terriglobales bacterium]
MRSWIVFAAMLALTACGGSVSNSGSGAVRDYNGTASVGDFLTISLNPATQTLSYDNYTSGVKASVPYTTTGAGTYTFTDPTGNLISGYEVPNYAFLIEADKAGPNQDTLALITAVETTPITLASFEGNRYNYMQFRTSSGGIDAGSVVIDAQANITTSSYWPYGAVQDPSDPFNSSSFSGSQIQEDPSGNFLTLAEGGGTDYIFGTSTGVFVVDTANGAILGFQKTASKAFDASFAGTYKAVFYERTNASVGQDNQESGTPSLGNASIVVDASGNVTMTDAQSNTLLAGTLSAVADASYLYGSPGELADPCYGLFTFRIMHGQQPQDVFVTFLNNSILFGSFSPVSKSGSGYEYLYGVGLK